MYFPDVPPFRSNNPSERILVGTDVLSTVFVPNGAGDPTLEGGTKPSAVLQVVA